MRDDEILDVEPQPDTDPHLTDPRSEEGNSRDLPADMSLGQIFLSFFKIGAFTFGGGWAMVPLIQKELVDKRGWLDDSEFVDILACLLYTSRCV